MKKSDLEAAFDYHFRVLGQNMDLPEPVPEFKFAKPRRWSVDRAWPQHRVAVEIEGGAYGKKIKCHNCHQYVRALKGDGSPGAMISMSGAHGGSRFQTDIEKYNRLALDGWILLRFTNEDIHGNPHGMMKQIGCALESRVYRVADMDALTERQEKILYLVAAGLATAEIAERLGTTETGVRKSMQMICEKTAVNNRAAAVARGLAWGMIKLEEIPWAGPIADLIK